MEYWQIVSNYFGSIVFLSGYFTIREVEIGNPFESNPILMI